MSKRMSSLLNGEDDTREEATRGIQRSFCVNQKTEAEEDR